MSHLLPRARVSSSSTRSSTFFMCHLGSYVPASHVRLRGGASISDQLRHLRAHVCQRLRRWHLRGSETCGGGFTGKSKIKVTIFEPYESFPQTDHLVGSGAESGNQPWRKARNLDQKKGSGVVFFRLGITNPQSLWGNVLNKGLTWSGLVREMGTQI